MKLRITVPGAAQQFYFFKAYFLPRTINLKSGCIWISFPEEFFGRLSALEEGGTIRLPSKKRKKNLFKKLNRKRNNWSFFVKINSPDKIISPDSTKVLRIHVTWVGALSASSTTKIWPDFTAFTNGLSYNVKKIQFTRMYIGEYKRLKLSFSTT